MTDRRGHRPQYGQKSFACTLIENQPVLIVSGDGREDSLRINQDVEVYQCLLEENKSADYQVSHEHKYWIQVCYGAVSVNDRPLVAGDGLAVWDEKAELKIRGIDPNSNFLLFRLK